MWRGHQAVQSSVQRWLLRGWRQQTSVVTNYHHQFSSARFLGGVASSYVATDKLLLQKPSILSAGVGLPSLVRYGDVRANNPSNPLLISSHAFSTRGYHGRKGPDFRGLQSVDEVIVTAYEHLDDMSRIGVCAFWTCISKLMTKRQPNQRSKSSKNNNNIGKLSFEDMEHMLYTVFDVTTDRIEDYNARDLTEITLGMAKIVKTLRQQGMRRGEDSSRVILRRLLLSEDLNPNRELFKFFANASVHKLDQFNARGLSNVAYAYALIDYVPEFDDGSDLFDLIAMNGVEIEAEFNAQDMSNMVWAYATVNKPHAVLFEAMGDQVVAYQHLGEFKHPQDFSNTMWAYAKAGVNHPKLFEKLANHVVDSKSLDRFKPQELSNIAWAYATAGFRHAKLFEKVANHIAESGSLDRFKPQELSNIAWAYATAGFRHAKLFEKVANHIAEPGSLDRFDPQALSNIVWAYSTAGVPNAKLFEKMANHIVESKSLARFTPQEFSNTLWAYATAGVRHPKLFEKVANHIVESDSLDRFNPQNLSNVVWAYAKAGVHHPKLFQKVANHIVESKSLDRFDPQALSNTVWAYATADMHHPKLFEKVASHIVESDSLDRFDPQALSNTVWSYATAQVHHPKLFKKVAEVVIQRKGEFISQSVANLLWAYATMGIVDKKLFLSFMPTAAKLIDSSTNQGIANIAWAYAVADVDAAPLFDDVFIKKCVEKKNAFKNEDLWQLHQWHLRQTKEKSNPGLPTDLKERCYNAFISEEPTVSKLQEDVVAQLSSIGLEPREEVLMDSGYLIDAVVAVNGKTVGVEVDGPSHFIGKSKLLGKNKLPGKSRLPLASTILKRRQVPSIDGIELVSVPYWEWDKLGKDQAKKQEYLRKLLSLTTDNS